VPDRVITVALTDCAAAHDAVALLAPLGIDTEHQRFAGFEPPDGWETTILTEPRSGQRAAWMVPPTPDARARVRHVFSEDGTALSADAFLPENSAVTIAAAELADDARALADRAGGGLPGIEAIVAETSARFSYGEVPVEDRWYYGAEAVPQVACAAGNCIDINTYLVAALRAAGYRTAYLTCYFFDDDPDGIASGMHCWVRTVHDGTVQDWDIAHFKKAGRTDVHAALNPVPGRRFSLAFGRDHRYRWRGADVVLSTPSRPMWVRTDGSAVWGEPPEVTLA